MSGCCAAERPSQRVLITNCAASGRVLTAVHGMAQGSFCLAHASIRECTLAAGVLGPRAGASHRPFQAFIALSRLAPMSLSETALSDLAEASASVIAEVEIWAPHQWVAVCEVHREPSNALRLAFHVASRSRRVVRAINEQPGSRVDVSQVHVDPTPLPEEAAEVVAALKGARDEALRFIVSLDDAAIERLHIAEIDGEPDALMATCGLIGHWAFHLPAIQRIQGVNA